MNEASTLAAKPIDKIDELTRRAAGKADEAITSAQRVANDSLDALHGQVETLREQVPSTLRRAAAQVDELARRGLDRASQSGHEVRQLVSRAGDRTVSYIRNEPLKSTLIAATSGAVIAAIIGLLARSGSAAHDRH